MARQGQKGLFLDKKHIVRLQEGDHIVELPFISELLAN